MKQETKEIIDDIDYLLKKINWGALFMDAKAIRILNELQKKIIKAIEPPTCSCDKCLGLLSIEQEDELAKELNEDELNDHS